MKRITCIPPSCDIPSTCLSSELLTACSLVSCPWFAAPVVLICGMRKHTKHSQRKLLSRSEPEFQAPRRCPLKSAMPLPDLLRRVPTPRPMSHTAAGILLASATTTGQHPQVSSAPWRSSVPRPGHVLTRGMRQRALSSSTYCNSRLWMSGFCCCTARLRVS